ncbi:MAG: NADH:flavin oxidoreductase [Actinobacteria bacterium]|nr:NADH:flavin oxidoreductase [Actinomycetota bacterium]
MATLFDEVRFDHGPAMSNRFMLAPLTNSQSNADGTLSDDEHHWLTMRAEGGFGLTMTCAAHVQAVGQGFPGQLGTFSDDHIPGLTRLAHDIKKHHSLAIVQLHHAGNRSPKELVGTPVCPSDDPATGARALTTAEVEQLVEDFVVAAVRCEKAGFDGVELHGAHGYVIAQFLSPEINQRTDQFGGSLANRSRILFDIIDGVRARTGVAFNLSVRLSPERFGLRTAEMVEVYTRLVDEAKVDFVDMSLWDVTKVGVDEDYKETKLIDVFAGIERGSVKLAVAGKLYSAADCRFAIEHGADFVAVGRGAILHHDFPRLCADDENFAVRALPVSRATLHEEGLSDTFISYMGNWPGFVAD